jgi:hypothetical protein
MGERAMRVSRRGTDANHGTSVINLNKVSASWNSSPKGLVLNSRRVRDFNTKATHDYTIAVPLNELALLLQAMGGTACKESASEVEAELAGALKDMVRLVATASGVALRGDADAPA